MSAHVPAFAAPEIGRRCVQFHPTVWGDRFLTDNSTDEPIDAGVEKKIHELIALMKSKLATATLSQQLNMMDAIQRLGLAYHFDTEIELALEHINNTYYDNTNNLDKNEVALRFRLLRQQGYTVSADVFNTFKDKDGNFEVALTDDVPTMLSLYEAAHLRVHGEDILDQAQAFSFKTLESIATKLTPPLATQVIHALKWPVRKCIPRMEARHYISVCEQDVSNDQALLMLAKLDFNRLQKIHQKELKEISKWWKDLNLVSNLPFVRDRVVECYFWILAVHSEPDNYLVRRTCAKLAAIVSIIDDIYDVYGTIDELKSFTEAVQRWDVNTMAELPEYMKICYVALLDIYKEIGEEMDKRGTSYRLHYTIEAMKDLIMSFFSEAKWLNEGYVPTIDEYMAVAEVSIGYNNAIVASFATATAGDSATKETFKWLRTNPKVVKASSRICRLMDDIASHKFEQKRGHVASAVECYMKQHGVTDEKACDELRKQVTDSWKVMNQECLKPTVIPMHLLMCVVNYATVPEIVYVDGDGYTFSDTMMKDHVSSLFINPISI